MPSLIQHLRRAWRALSSSGADRPRGTSSAADPADECAWLQPPDDPRDAAAWDRHWDAQIAHGVGPAIFDMFCRDAELIGAMRAAGLRRVRCAGSGMSLEPRALAEAGFEVSALDQSAHALAIADAFPLPEGQLAPAG